MSMIEVSREKFFEVVGGPRDIHPRPEPEYSEWRDQKTHQVVGRSQPGYKNAQAPRRYWLIEELAK